MILQTGFQLARRPGHCTRGSIYEVYSNTFELRSYPKVTFFHYDVISPSPRNVPLAQAVIHRMMHHTAPQLFSLVVAAFDGAKNLYSLQRPLFQEGQMTFSVNMRDHPPDGPDDRGLFSVILTKVADIPPSDLERVLQGHSPGVPVTTTPLQVLNVLVQQAAALHFQVHTKNRYYIDSGYESIGGFEIWRGFFASIRPTAGKLFLNVDMATTVVYQRGPLIDFIFAYFSIQDVRDLYDMDENSRYWDRLRGILKGKKVITGPKGRLRTIRTIVPRAGTVEFGQNGQNTTVELYFREKYSYNVRYPLIPGIWTARDECIPFELCKIKEGQFFRKKASPQLTSRMLNFAKKKPEERLGIVKRGIQMLQLDNAPSIVQAGIKIKPESMSIQGRLLDPPTMIYGQETMEKPRSGSWNLLGKKLRAAIPIEIWSVICLDPDVQLDSVQGFATNLMAAMANFEVLEKPVLQRNSGYQINQDLTELCQGARKHRGRNPDILIVILPQSAAPQRKEVKQFGDINHGIVTQCVRSDKMKQAGSQYLNNLILKINAKLGGVNFVPSGESPSFRWFVDGKTMVVGADVSHPGPGVMRPSVAAVVSSVDERAAKYVAKCAVQGPRTEIIEDLENLMDNALRMFYGYRNHLSKKLQRKDIPLLPEKIVFYRDGVSEGEIQRVVEHEIEKVMNAIENAYGRLKAPFRAKLTFVVVGKGHHIRFFPKQSRSADKSGNAPAGLLVDQDITAPGIFDFYLQSHAGLLGTSRPSHYIVIKDDNNFDASTLQSFSFDLCHTYARATRSVSIPAPVYYADVRSANFGMLRTSQTDLSTPQIACSRADFHFHDSLNYADDLSSSGEFNLGIWVQGFSNVHPAQSEKMYFM
ncbi:hypothetical protein ACEPAH_4931 [Sanghuangporus vaninii]